MQNNHATPSPSRLPIILGATMVLALAGLAHAEPGTRAQRHGPPGPGPYDVPVECKAKHFAEHGAAFDRNSDGKLDRDERRAMHQAKRQNALTAYDKDGDGRLSRAERQTMHHDRMVEHFEALDANRDAEITRSEATGSCTPVEWSFADADTDSNGSITWTEFETAGQRFRPGPMRHRRGQRGKHRNRGQHRGPGAQ